MKRFTVRKVKCYSYSRQGWKLGFVGFRFVVVDREWRANIETTHGKFYMATREQENAFKNVDSFYTRAGAQYVADWLNANRINDFGGRFRIPGTVFNEAIKMRDEG